MKTLPKRFRDPRIFGEGAVGIVYEAWDQTRQERVALKTLHKVSASAIRDFKREFRAVADISHENLVILHELFCEQELWFFTMELVQGQPLLGGGRGNDVPGLTGDELRRQLVQLARGISALHQVGVIHRDIKPQNVLVEPAGRVVLLDYGMATSAPQQAGAWDGTFAGSPGYVAPELVFGESLSLASDWYSFGCVLYEALTGMLPFEDGAGAILLRKLMRDPTPPSRLAEAVPDDLERLCLALLERDPAARPDAQAVLHALGDAGPVSRPRLIPSSRTSFPPVSRPFVGRDHERREVCDWLAPDTRLGPRVALLAGPSGIGNTSTSLVVSSTSDVLVLRSRCLKCELVPFNVWDGILDELASELGARAGQREIELGPALPRLFPELSSAEQAAAPNRLPGDPAELRSEGARALRQLFAELCADRRVLFFIDDLQWADADSVRLLRELLLGPGAPPLGVLATLRPGEGESVRSDGLIDELSAEGRCRSFAIGPLGPSESLALLDAFDDLDAAARAAVLVEAEGNPFLLTELARDAQLPGGASRLLLSDVLEQRLRELSPTARALFEVIGVIGRPLPLGVAGGAAGVGGRALEELHRLRARGLVRWGGTGAEDTVETYHDRWRVALESVLAQSRRGECFRALAVAYEAQQRPEDAEILSFCYEQSAEPELAARHALAAARGAELALAFERAASCYGKALELGHWPLAEQVELLTRLGAMANAAGRGAMAGEAFQRAAALVDDAPRIEMLRRAAQAFMSSGHQDHGERLLGEVLTAVGRAPPRGPARALALYLWERLLLARRGLTRRPQPLTAHARQRLEAVDVAAALWMNHNPVLSWTYAMRELRWALDADDDTLLLRALSRELVFASSELQRAGWIEALVELGRRIAGGVRDPIVLALHEYVLTLRAFLAGDWSEAEERARAVEHRLRTECTGVHWELALVRRVYVAAIQIRGDMLAAEPLILDWLKDAEQRDDREGIVTHLLGLGYCHLSRDEPERIRPLLERSLRLMGSDHSGTFNLTWVEAITLCYTGAPASALMAVLDTLREVHRSSHGRVMFYRVWTRGYESRLLAALAVESRGPERKRWLGELRRLGQRLSREPWSHAQSVEKSVEGSVLWLSGDRDGAVRAIDESAAINERSGARLFAAVARLASAHMRGDDVGHERATAALVALRVRDVARMARAHLPAFWPPPA